MMDIGTDTARATSAPTFLPLQRRGDRSVPFEAVDLRSTTVVDHAILPPPLEVVPPPVEVRPRQRSERAVVVSADVVAGAAAAVVDWRLGLVAASVVLPATALAGLQRRRFSPSVLDEAPRVVRAAGWVAGALVIAGLTVGIAASAALLAGLVSLLGLFALRAFAYARVRTLRRTGRSIHPVVLVGAASGDIARRVQEHPETGLRVVGTAGATGKVHLVEGGSTTVGAAIERYGVRDVILDACGDRVATSTWLRNLSWRDLSVHVVLPQVGATPVRGWDDHVWGVPLMRMHSGLRFSRMRWMKRATDVVVSAGALVVLAPLLGAVSLLVRREVGGPIIFRQERVGLDGRTFEVFKFRSMRDLAPGEVSPWSVKAGQSDRIGPVGRFIRKYSIDELPQLWNVLRGDMSLVGPRPERPEYVTRFSADFPQYGARHRAPVGLTGLAAVEGLRGDTSIEDRAHFDNLYVDSWTFWADLKIVARTVLAVIRGTGS